MAEVTPLAQKRWPPLCICQRSSEARRGARSAEFLRVFAGRLVFRGKQDADILAHDLVARVAEDAFGAGVPRRDVALRIRREDRVVADILNDQPVAFLRFAQRVFDPPPLAEGRAEFRKPYDASVVRSNRRDDFVPPEALAVLRNCQPSRSCAPVFLASSSSAFTEPLSTCSRG